MDWHNYHYRFSGASRPFRAILTSAGLLLVAFGVLILLVPWLLQLLVGMTFVMIGLAILGFAWRRPVQPQPPRETGGEPDVIDDWR